MKINSFIKSISNILLLAMPISASGIVNAITSFFSMMMVARLGKESLAAGALAVPTFLTIITVTATIFYAIGILSSHALGVNKASKEIGLIVKNGFWLAMVLAIFAGLALWHADQLLVIFRQDPQLVVLTRTYFHFAALNMFPLLAFSVISQFFAGIGKPRFTLLFSLISLPLTLVTAYGTIFGYFGLPKMGLSGIPCASLIVQSFMMIVIMIFIFLNKSLRSYGVLKSPFLPSWNICKNILTLGLPIGIQFGGEFVAITIATYLLGHFGVSTLAAAQIAGQYYMLIIIFLIGLTQSLSILISNAYAKKDYNLITDHLNASIAILMICCMFVFFFFLYFPKELIHLYVSGKILDIQLEHLAITFFAINGLLFLVDGLRHLLSGALRGLQDSQGPMQIGIIGLWFVSLPACYLIGVTYQGGPVGLRLGFLTGFILAAIFLVLRIRKKLNLIKQVELDYEAVYE